MNRSHQHLISLLHLRIEMIRFDHEEEDMILDLRQKKFIENIVSVLVQEVVVVIDLKIKVIGILENSEIIIKIIQVNIHIVKSLFHLLQRMVGNIMLQKLETIQNFVSNVTL